MHRHLVTIKVSIESRAHQRMYLYGAPVNQHRLKSLDTEAVQCGSPVKHNRSFFNHLLQNIVNLGLGPLHQAPGAFDIGGQPFNYQLVHYKGLE